MGIIIISCILTNLFIILISGIAIYKICKSQQSKIDSAVNEMSNKLKEVATSLEEAKCVLVDLSEEIQGIEDEVRNLK